MTHCNWQSSSGILVITFNYRKMNNKRYFHIQDLNGKNILWNKGEVVKIDDLNHNSYYKNLTNCIGRKIDYNGKEIDLMEYEKHKEKEINNLPFKLNPEDKVLLKDYEQKNKIYRELACEMSENLRQYLKWIREEIFENFRKQKFPNLPSRKTCLWLCEEKDVQMWWNILYPYNSKKIIEIYFDSGQQIHCGNGSLIIEKTLNIEDFTKLAEEYWSGRMTANCQTETLFQGTFKVINEFGNPEEI